MPSVSRTSRGRAQCATYCAKSVTATVAEGWKPDAASVVCTTRSLSGRPTLEELRQDLRTVMRESSSYPYDAWNTDRVKAVRIPAQDWLGEIPALGANGLRVSSGVVKWFDLQSGNGVIQPGDSSEEVYFNFTAIPGEGYRTIRPGANVRFEVVDGLHGLSARNVQETSK